MKEIQYQDFSLKAHAQNWRFNRPNMAQFELTFGCGLYCRHCYSDCYNKPALLKKELETKEVKLILNKIRAAGVIWCCFSGGDPLTRPDFLDIYACARRMGFIVTLFTNGYSMTKEIASYLKRSPPFAIEITLNAANEELYEKISQVRGSFGKVVRGIDLMLKAGLPLKIKTQITSDNFGDYFKIKKFIEILGLKFYPSFELHARLNGDLAPCRLRLAVEEIARLNGRHSLKDDCLSNSGLNQQGAGDDLFRCSISGGDGFHVDPYGDTFPCLLIRNPRFSLLVRDIASARQEVLSSVRDKKFASDSRCKGCGLREVCVWCPGRAYIETGSKESPVEYYCRLAKTLGSIYG